MPKFSIVTLGCKVNQYESESISQSLTISGWIEVKIEEEPDLFIVNTCAVTGKASMQSRQALRRLNRLNPKALVLVTGCFAQAEKEEIKKIGNFHYIIGNADKNNIPEIILKSWGKEDNFYIFNDLKQDIFSTYKAPVSYHRTRPFLKIQDGCDAFCTYCIVPYLRGKSRSMPLYDVISNIKQIKDKGFHEVVLSGIHLGRYGLDLSPNTNLFNLLTELESLKAIDRIRLSSIEPLELNEKIINLVRQSDILCKHFHIPLQSGDDSILKQMNRPYSCSQFKNLIEMIYKSIPDAAIGLDVLVGFPGESDKAFENTYFLISELPISYLHVFPFSARAGTPASKFPNQVSSQIIRDRCMNLRALSSDKKIAFYKKNQGKIIKILIEDKRDKNTGFLKGLTSNYIPVLVNYDKDELNNKIIKVKIDNIEGQYLVFGSIIEIDNYL